MATPIDLSRRWFVGAATTAIAAGSLGMVGCAGRASTLAKRATPMSFEPIQQIQAGVLDVGYVDSARAMVRP
jgi:hypothetical protein